MHYIHTMSLPAASFSQKPALAYQAARQIPRLLIYEKPRERGDPGIVQ
jgi:hypothetical protein